MPLVVPGLTSKGEDERTNKWMNELVGKKIGENKNETVCHPPSPLSIPQRRQLSWLVKTRVLINGADLRKERPPLRPQNHQARFHGYGGLSARQVSWFIASEA